jgi:hypothetical protein
VDCVGVEAKRGAAERLLTGGSELSVSVRKVRRQHGHSFDRCRGEYRKRGQRRGACTLRIGAGGVGLGVVMARMIMAGVIMAGAVLHGARRIRVAQHDSQSPGASIKPAGTSARRQSIARTNGAAQWRAPPVRNRLVLRFIPARCSTPATGSSGARIYT